MSDAEVDPSTADFATRREAPRPEARGARDQPVVRDTSACSARKPPARNAISRSERVRCSIGSGAQLPQRDMSSRSNSSRQCCSPRWSSSSVGAGQRAAQRVEAFALDRPEVPREELVALVVAREARDQAEIVAPARVRARVEHGERLPDGPQHVLDGPHAMLAQGRERFLLQLDETRRAARKGFLDQLLLAAEVVVQQARRARRPAGRSAGASVSGSRGRRSAPRRRRAAARACRRRVAERWWQVVGCVIVLMTDSPPMRRVCRATGTAGRLGLVLHDACDDPREIGSAKTGEPRGLM